MMRNLDNQFLVMFRAKGPSVRDGSLEIAVDDVQIVGEGVERGGGGEGGGVAKGWGGRRPNI
jgi:hypothetical protein